MNPSTLKSRSPRNRNYSKIFTQLHSLTTLFPQNFYCMYNHCTKYSVARPKVLCNELDKFLNYSWNSPENTWHYFYTTLLLYVIQIVENAQRTILLDARWAYRIGPDSGVSSGVCRRQVVARTLCHDCRNCIIIAVAEL